ncbi:uncharacterized protein LOC126266276 [Aethina tumida]|uniref:uncharacterized protein LOC126266276 n=1 Tax=Aethina tumida TaxID=116153 RepID=UPI002147ACF2|nr:uncharacterized protein LOC126266276 [Aethina tumida]
MNYNSPMYDPVYFFVPLSGASEDMYFAIWFFKNYCGSLQKVLIPLYYLSFVALFLGSVEQFFGLYWGMTPDTYPRMICLSIISIAILILVAIIGQKFTNVSETVFDATLNIKWYTFNTENKRMLHIFLMNCINSYTLAMSETVILDYSIMIKVANNLYSMATVLSGFASRQAHQIELANN